MDLIELPIPGGVMFALHACSMVSMLISMSVDDLDKLQCSWVMIDDGRRCWLDI